MQRQERDPTPQPVIAALEGQECSFCGDGKLVRNTYKGNDAVICDACDTPGAQFW